MTNTEILEDAAVRQSAFRPGTMLLVLLTGQAMATMDNSIVNVAVPAIRADIGASDALLQMVIAGYLLPYAVSLITAARLGDDYGYRRIFIIGVALFTMASLACGTAPNAPILIAARVAQGIGAALLVPQILSLIQRFFDGQVRSRVVGYYSMILAAGVNSRPVAGGRHCHHRRTWAELAAGLSY